MVSTLFLSTPTMAQEEGEDDELLNFIIEFNTVLDQVVSDYPNNFKNLLGDARPKEEGSSQIYNSRISLPEELESYFSETITQGNKLTYVSVFAEYPDSTQARDIYSGLSFIVSLFTFDCCEMDIVESDGTQSVYMAMMQLFPKDNPEGFEDLEIRVGLFKSFDIDEQLNFTDKYIVVLNVRPKDV